MRPIISSIFEELVARHRESKRIDLDDIAEVIGSRAVSQDEVEYLVDRLEAEGFSVGEGIDASDVEVMQVVLSKARELHRSLGRRPTVDEIAQGLSMPTYVVRRALERASGKHVTKQE
ncbi:MAG TPA: sigma-70 domain-containing protein [Polyangium sp.]|nr:sigma-70 domain-containing protein [Polyangium sp.]